MSRPDTVVVAGAIAEGNGTEHDSWVKHQNKFDDLNLQSRDQFKVHCRDCDGLTPATPNLGSYHRSTEAQCDLLDAAVATG